MPLAPSPDARPPSPDVTAVLAGPAAIAKTDGEGIKVIRRQETTMATVELDEETVERLDALRVDDESYDELVTELMNIYETSEMTMFHAGDRTGD